MYNLIAYNSNCSKTTGSLWFYSNDEATNFDNAIADDDNFKSFKYKIKGVGQRAAANGILENVAIPALLKYRSNFWRSLEMALINCKTELKPKWTKHCVLATGGNSNYDANSNNIIFTIKDTKSYVFLDT